MKYSVTDKYGNKMRLGRREYSIDVLRLYSLLEGMNIILIN